MKKILFITTEYPWPQISGGRLRTGNMIKALRQNNYFVHLICFFNLKNSEIDKYKQLYDKIDFFKPNNKIISALKSIFFIKPYIYIKYYSIDLLNYLKKLNIEEYDYIYLDHLHTYQYNICFKNKKIILDNHNIEHLLWYFYFRKKFNPFYLLQYYLTKATEKNIKKGHKIITVSEEDKKKIIGLNSDYEVNTIRNIIDINSYDIKNKKDIDILIIGDLEWGPNFSAAEFFIKRIYSKELKEKKIIIAGRKAGKLERIFKLKIKGIELIEEFNSKEILSRAKILLVLPQYGSGTCLKILEGILSNCIIITNKVGGRGLLFADKIIAYTNPLDIKNQVIECLEKYDIYRGKNKELIQMVKENYSVEYAAEKLKEILEKDE